VSTQSCLSSLHSHDYELTPECSFGFLRASLQDWPLPASSPWVLKGKVTLWHSHGHELTYWQIESTRRASKFSSNLALWWPGSVSPNSLDYGRKVHLQTRSITVLECISKFTCSRSPSSHERGLQVHLQTRSIMVSKYIPEFTRLASSATPRIALKHRLQPVQIYCM